MFEINEGKVLYYKVWWRYLASVAGTPLSPSGGGGAVDRNIGRQGGGWRAAGRRMEGGKVAYDGSQGGGWRA